MAMRKAALVHIQADGSVRVAYPGTEVGQGISIKVLQTACYELSKVSACVRECVRYKGAAVLHMRGIVCLYIVNLPQHQRQHDSVSQVREAR
jgi:hypothetical protein